MEHLVVSDPEEARKLRCLADAGRIPVVGGGLVLGAAGRGEESARALLRGLGGEAGASLTLTDAACLWIGDHPPRAARAVKVPGDKRPYVAVRVWAVERAGG